MNKRKKLIRRFKYSTFFVKSAFVLTLCVVFWLLGVIYEHELYEKQLRYLEDYTIETYYFVNPEVVDPFPNGTKDLFVKGELLVGRCINREGVRRLLVDKDR